MLNSNFANDNGGTAMTLEEAEREIAHATEISSHPHIVKLLEVFYSCPAKERLVMVWELVDGQDLLDLVNSLNPNVLPEPRARRYFRQLLSAVKYIQANGFCHRDIKVRLRAALAGRPETHALRRRPQPENCMIETATDRLKVIDFGMSKHLASAKTLMIGTPDYMAPELLSAGFNSGAAGKYDARAVDVWSMGALLYICVSGVFPFEDPQQPNNMTVTLENVRHARYRTLPGHASAELQELIHRVFQANPKKRITLDGLAHHAWLVDFPELKTEPPCSFPSHRLTTPPAGSERAPAKRPQPSGLEKLAASMGSLFGGDAKAEEPVAAAPAANSPRKWPKWLAAPRGRS